jgi:hypothetical protein
VSNPTRLGGQIGERQKDARLRLSGTARRELEMKTGAPVLPFSFSDLDARQSGDVWANVGSWQIVLQKSFCTVDRKCFEL